MIALFRKLISTTLLAALLLGGLALAFPTGTAAAQDTQPPAQDQPPAAERTARLERQYQRQQKALAAQAERLDNIGERTGKLEARIQELKDKGKDTTALEEALANFEARIAEARELHDQAAAILAAHQGFDENGKVTEPKAALETVQEAGKLMQQAHKELRPALRELAKAVRTYFRDNR